MNIKKSKSLHQKKMKAFVLKNLTDKIDSSTKQKILLCVIVS
ncbi:MAG: hypothetical protein RIQ33_1852 [Bacteroidota bacterium]|jgi:hypothetical protein